MSKFKDGYEKVSEKFYTWRKANPTRAIILYAFVAIVIAFWVGVAWMATK